MMNKRIRYMISCMLLLVLLCAVWPAASAGNSVDLRNWMKDLPDDIRVSEINLPGTHDSGTTYMRAAVSGSGRCQRLDISGQLNAGMRVLDLRLDEYGGKTQGEKVQKLMLNHDKMDCFESGDALADQLTFAHVFDDVATFLYEHPDETVILYCSAEGNDKDKAKYILKDFVTDFRYNRTENPYTKGYPYWWHYYIDAYFPGDPVPTLGNARGKAIVILNDSGIDNELPAYRSATEYEMACNLGKHLDGKVSNKVERMERLFDHAVTNDWYIRYADHEYLRLPVFHQENYSNNEGSGEPPYGNPDIKYIGTNINGVDGFITWVTEDGPYGCACEFWKGMKSENIIDHIKPGYRYGWITMDFPERYMEFTYAIIQSNFPDFIYRVEVTGIPRVPKENIYVTVTGLKEDPEIHYSEYTDGTISALWFESKVNILDADGVSVTVKAAAAGGVLYSGTADRSYNHGVLTDSISMQKVNNYSTFSFSVLYPRKYNSATIPASSDKFLKMFGKISVTQSGTGNVISVGETGKAKADRACLTDYSSSVYPVNGYFDYAHYRFTLNLPAYDDNGKPFSYTLTGFEDTPADCPYEWSTKNVMYLIVISTQAYIMKNVNNVLPPKPMPPRTGDAAPVWLWAALLGLSAVSLSFLLIRRRVKRHTR